MRTLKKQLEIWDLSAGYERIQVLQKISISVGTAEIVALVGSNGAGKTTFMNTVSGIHKAAKGSRIIFEDKDLTRLAAPARVRAGLVLVPERRQIWPEISVMDHLTLGGFLRLRDQQYVAQQKEFCMELFPRLKDRLKQAAGTLSGGEQQMLAMARALMAGPKLLLLDEPSTGLSPLFVERIFDAIVQLRAKTGVSILLVEQMVTQTLEVADRGYVLDRGEIVGMGTGEELLADPAVQAAYLGDEAEA